MLSELRVFMYTYDKMGGKGSKEKNNPGPPPGGGDAVDITAIQVQYGYKTETTGRFGRKGKVRIC